MDQTRKLKQTIFEMYKMRREGDLLMDAPETRSWRELTTYEWDKDYWRTRVRAMRQPRVTVEVSGMVRKLWKATLSFTVST